MTTPNQTQIQDIQLTPAAAEIVRGLRLQQNLNEGYALRVYISAQTCSGFQYGMALDNNALPTDTIFDSGGFKVIIDEISIQYMAGAIIDYIDDQRGKGFLVENPNGASACSCDGGTCGTSEN
ncbi:MAG TPA: iron-sulfur cluster assembly accessory protein [Anaerolineales bacterium]